MSGLTTTSLTGRACHGMMRTMHHTPPSKPTPRPSTEAGVRDVMALRAATGVAHTERPKTTDGESLRDLVNRRVRATRAMRRSMTDR